MPDETREHRYTSHCPIRHMDLLSCCDGYNLCLLRCLFAVVTTTSYLLAQVPRVAPSDPHKGVGQDAAVSLALSPDTTGSKYYASLRNVCASPLFLVLGTI